MSIFSRNIRFEPSRTFITLLGLTFVLLSGQVKADEVCEEMDFSLKKIACWMIGDQDDDDDEPSAGTGVRANVVDPVVHPADLPVDDACDPRLTNCDEIPATKPTVVGRPTDGCDPRVTNCTEPVVRPVLPNPGTCNPEITDCTIPVLPPLPTTDGCDPELTACADPRPTR